jgi:glycosyltransferase involved in cell wall biosynthesis
MSKAVNLMRYYARLVLYLYRHRRSVVHFTGIFRNALILFEGFVLSLCFRLLSSRYVYTVHNVLPHNKENKRFLKWVYRLVYKIPDTLLVHTRLAKQQLVEQFSVPDQKVIVISIGVNEEMPVTEITREEARRRMGFDARDRIVLFFGKVDEFKGLDILIEAFEVLELPSTKLLISGWFPNPSYRQKIISALGATRRKADIHLHEAFIPNEEVEIFFKSADVLALPYRNIYQSGVVFLCFNFGLPIVATNVGSLQEFVGEEMGIITRTNDAPGVADGLRRFFETQNRFRREHIIAKAAKYKWENICKVLTPLYK